MELVLLNNGFQLPYVGLGTFKLRTNVEKDLVYNVLDVALQTGYRLIDTASCYRNEEDIGKALSLLYKKHGLSREDVAITSKLAPKDMDYTSAIATCEKTLSDLQCDYIDCYLVHWPGRAKLKPDDTAHSQHRKDVWFAFQDLVKKGYVRSIGVSNFTQGHLEELLQYAEIKPILNQVEFHPHLHQLDLLNYCRDKNIHLQAYSSLATGELINNTTISALGAKYNRSSSQILLKWALQQGVGVIPKSTKPDHIRSNFQLFDFSITEEDLSEMNKMNANKHYCWDPYKIK